MKCPNDQTTLVMSERSGIEIDYCPECRGVWLDRGELDKIIERANGDSYPSSQPESRQQPSGFGQDSYGYRDEGFRYDEHRGDSGYRRKKKEHWLGELFG
ncbi:TFIIB-type zinc ribbon-containing protein [Herbiconiux sp. SYSU D00978]|uniref:TFIIB-type zinc ribbon-containing protein n=1 Tax=Herbiconiux sp. SYSU D00978 TaxID=2812562 RepID=UPI001A957943|nr:zf-TFIIB domain-containing protein [Herbiconiux sp. SYSU D00978]